MTSQTQPPPQKLSIPSDGNLLAGDYYRPAHDGPCPVVVMAGGWCYVKELVMPSYARALASRGIATLVFDYRSFGASEGSPRYHIDPWQQIADYRNCISFLERRSDVDSDAIGAWGISYSGGHVLILGAIDPRVKAVASIVPVIDGYQNMRLAHGTIGFRRLQAALLEARRSSWDTDALTYLAHQPESEGAIATWPFPASRPAFAKLKMEEAPAYEGKSTAASTEMLLSYSVAPFLQRLAGKPVQMVLAEGDDHTHWELALDAYAQIPGTEKHLRVVPKSNHLSLYNDEGIRSDIASQVGEFFSSCLWSAR